MLALNSSNVCCSGQDSLYCRCQKPTQEIKRRYGKDGAVSSGTKGWAPGARQLQGLRNRPWHRGSTHSSILQPCGVPSKLIHQRWPGLLDTLGLNLGTCSQREGRMFPVCRVKKKKKKSRRRAVFCSTWAICSARAGMLLEKWGQAADHQPQPLLRQGRTCKLKKCQLTGTIPHAGCRIALTPPDAQGNVLALLRGITSSSTG